MLLEESSSKTTSGRLVPHASAVFSGITAEMLLGGNAAPMTAMRMTVEKDHGAPQHISHQEDKLLLVLSGSLLFNISDERIEAEAGDIFFVPRGVLHGFAARGNKADVVLISTPAKHDRFFAAMGALPLPHEMAEVAAICDEFGQTIVGPVIND